MRPGRWIAAGCIAGAAAAVAVITAEDEEAARASPPPALVRDCGSRGEPSGRPPRGAIRLGPVAFPAGFEHSPSSLLTSRARQVGFRRYLRGRGGRALPAGERRALARLAETHHVPLKYGVHVRASTRVTLAIAPQDRQDAAFLFGGPLGRPAGRQVGPYWSVSVKDGQAAVALEACRASEPRFSGPGRVGPYTAFPAALVVAGARCVTFQVWVPGRDEPHEREMRFGVPRCLEPAAAG